MKKIIVTGGSGKAGRYIIEDLLSHGYEVINVDIKHHVDSLGIPIEVDLSNLGQVYNVLAGADAVIHMAAIPRPRGYTSQVVFENNSLSTYNVLEACHDLNIRKVVIASSESIYGLAHGGPQYVPMDEEHPLTPIDSYALSKIVNEQSAHMFHRKSGMQIVSLRIGNVMSPEDYIRFQDFKAENRKNILWSYIDARDLASACRLSIELDGLKDAVLNIAANDTSMNIKSQLLMDTYYPLITDFRKPLDGYVTLLSNEKAKKLLSWNPIHTWRSELEHLI